jgi:hypothetical protein
MKQLLKVYFLFLFSLVCSANIQGQAVNAETLKKQKESAVYFASGSSELNPQALEVLNMLLKDESNLELAQFRLQAFTDDVGSPVRNASLAKSRATQVQEYLSKQGIATDKIEIQAFQQLHLNPDENVTEQRANNRRVVVEYWAVPLKTAKELSDESALALEKFFTRDQKEYQQNFSFSAAKGTIIEGEKGTVLQIPANCFVDSKGNAVTGEISFLLQEAYSYSDMLFQNLSTVSNGELLETGGMLFIEARDTIGNVLGIREGAEIIAAMASTAAQLPEMQSFEGELDSTTNRINWVATNEPALTNDQNTTITNNRGVTTNQNRLYQRSTLNASLDGLKKIPSWESKLPREVERPKFKLRTPKYPRLYVLDQPSKEALKIKIPQKPDLEDAVYNSKIRKKFQTLQRSYHKKVQSNRSKKNDYRRDSIRYEKALVKHGKNTAKYQVYNESMRLVLGEMNAYMTSFNLGVYEEEYDALRGFVTEFQQRNTQMFGGKRYVEDQLNNNSVYDTVAQTLQAKLKSINLSSFTEEESQLLEACWSRKLDKKIANYFLRKEYNSSRFRNNRHRVVNVYNRAPETENLKPYQLRQIRRMKSIIDKSYNYKSLLKVDEEIQRKKGEALPLITRFLDMEKSIIDLEKEFLEIRTELNILTPIEVASVYNNALRIRNVGWFNCDRFIQRLNSMELEIITDYTENTRVYVALKGRRRSIFAANPDQISFKVPRIPKGRVVKIIGVRAIGDNMEVFLEEGTAQSLKGVRPTFKKKTKEEVEAMLLAI